ncbi:hypothetical protein WMF45_45835 [Sorangium sp. So ce448]|uniref:hypothetical protein n=1 Tax=Sorangium sp. So ce448 TaxID=3133314 RepID=UPI003F5F933F
MAKHEMERSALGLRLQDSAWSKMAGVVARQAVPLPSPAILRAAEQMRRALRGVVPRT